jgi:hypothetical protein
MLNARSGTWRERPRHAVAGVLTNVGCDVGIQERHERQMSRVII